MNAQFLQYIRPGEDTENLDLLHKRLTSFFFAKNQNKNKSQNKERNNKINCLVLWKIKF